MSTGVESKLSTQFFMVFCFAKNQRKTSKHRGITYHPLLRNRDELIKSNCARRPAGGQYGREHGALLGKPRSNGSSVQVATGSLLA
jgi:hypothetical protein